MNSATRKQNDRSTLLFPDQIETPKNATLRQIGKKRPLFSTTNIHSHRNPPFAETSLQTLPTNPPQRPAQSLLIRRQDPCSRFLLLIIVPLALFRHSNSQTTLRLPYSLQRLLRGRWLFGLCCRDRIRSKNPVSIAIDNDALPDRSKGGIDRWVLLSKLTLTLTLRTSVDLAYLRCGEEGDLARVDWTGCFVRRCDDDCLRTRRRRRGREESIVVL